MSIEWEEIEAFGPSLGAGADKLIEGIGGSGETYRVWYGQAFLNPDTPEKRWVAYGWPEPDTDHLPTFESYDEAVALCDRWEEIKLGAEKLARASFAGLRAGQPTMDYRSIRDNRLHLVTANSVSHTFDLLASALIAYGLSTKEIDQIVSRIMEGLSDSFDAYSGITRVEVLRLLNDLHRAIERDKNKQ